MAFNLAIGEHDDDGNAVSAGTLSISEEQAKTIKDLWDPEWTTDRLFKRYGIGKWEELALT